MPGRSAIDPGEPTDAAAYAAASVRVVGKALGDSLTMTGRRILFAVTVSATARRRAAAERRTR